MSNKDIKFLSKQILPYSNFLNYNYFFIDSNSRYFSLNCYVDRGFWFKSTLSFFLNLPVTLFYIIDGIQFKGNYCTITVQFNYNTMVTSDHYIFSVSLPNTSLELLSLSTIFNSTTWLERELSEFSKLLFKGLSDTRRLLSDYFQPKMVIQTHTGNDKFFDNNIYDICLAF